MTKTYYQPLGANEMPKFAGPATFMRLPARPDADGLDACFDLVEVSPPYDPLGNTACIAANLLYEMLCSLPGVKSK